MILQIDTEKVPDKSILFIAEYEVYDGITFIEIYVH